MVAGLWIRCGELVDGDGAAGYPVYESSNRVLVGRQSAVAASPDWQTGRRAEGLGHGTKWRSAAGGGREWQKINWPGAH